MAIYPGQVVYGQIDQNNGAHSQITPYLLVATGGNVGVAGYTWTTPPGASLPNPAIVIQPIGIVTDATPASLKAGTYPLDVEVTDGTATKTGSVTLDLTSVCNSNSSSPSYAPCTSAAVPTNVHIDYLPTGTVGSPYAASIATSGGTPPYMWVAGGTPNLPPGIGIVKGQGLFTGTPTAGGIYSFQVLTTDSAGASTAAEIKAGVLAAFFTITVSGGGGGGGGSTDWFYHWDCHGDPGCLATNPNGTPSGTLDEGPSYSACSSLLTFGTKFWNIPPATQSCDHSSA